MQFKKMLSNLKKRAFNSEVTDLDLLGEVEEFLKQLGTFFYHNPRPVIMLDLDANIFYSNPQMSALTGYSTDELHCPFIKITPTSYHNKNFRYFVKAKNGEPQEHNSFVQHKEGDMIEVLISSVPINFNGKVIGVYKLFIDIRAHTLLHHKVNELEEKLSLAELAGNIGSWNYDVMEEKLYWSEQAYALFEIKDNRNGVLSTEEVIKLIHPDDAKQLNATIAKAMIDKSDYQEQYRILLPGGKVKYILEQGSMILDKADNVVRLIGTLCDVTKEKNLEAMLVEREEVVERMYQRLDVGIWEFNTVKNRCMICSAGVEKILETDAQSLLKGHLKWRDFVHPHDLAEYDQKQQLLLSGQVVRYQYRIQTPEGKVKWLEDHTEPILDKKGELIQTHGIITDISENRHLLERVNAVANHDYLTFLPNRYLLEEKIKSEIALSNKENGFALFIIGIDRFKFINDTLGHRIGDEVLIKITKRLNVYQKTDYFLFKIGGHIFSLIYKGNQNIETIKKISDDILASLSEPFYVEEYELFLTSNIGVSLYPLDGKDVHSLLQNAHVAMYRSQELGKNTFQMYTSNLNANSYKLYTLDRDMRKGVKNKEFSIHYQPKVRPTDNKIIGAEALMRWNHPVWGMVAAGEFISIAEENGVILEMGDWIIEKVCQQIRVWIEKEFDIIPISINISPQQLLSGNLVSYIKACIEKYSIPLSMLEIEITEGSLIANPKEVFQTIVELKELGIKVALDDFGSGFSSLSHLKDFAIDVVKIDRSFVKDIVSSEKNKIIVKSLLSMCKGLGVDLVVEGVETKEQHEFLKQNEVRIIQGYAYSKPLPENVFLRILKQGILEPSFSSIKPYNSERRKYFRVTLPQFLKGGMTITEINGKEIQMKAMEIVIKSLGIRGLRFASHLQLPVRSDITMEFTQTVMGEEINMLGNIVWKEDIGNNLFQYGIQFHPNERGEEILTRVLNQLAMNIKKNKSIPDTPFIEENITSYLQQIKDNL